jgi:hypothetical protein
MSGLWMILLLAFSQPDELLPAPKNEALPKPLMVASNMEPQQLPVAAPECKIGWGTDPSDRSMYLVIQLAPESIAQFAAGGSSMELESIIPAALRGRVQKVIVRVGSGPVEQSPPESELDRLPALNASNGATGSSLISNLDMRSPVSIDSPRNNERSSAEIVTTSGSPQVPVVPGLSLPAVPSPTLPSTSVPSTSVPSASRDVLPTTSTPMASYPPTTYSTPIVNNPVPATGVAPPASTSSWSGSSSPSGYSSDGFAPMPRSDPSTLNPFGKSGLANTTTSSQGNVTYSSPNPTPSYGNYNAVPHMASNPNAPQGGYVLPSDNYSGYVQNQNGFVQNGYVQNGYATQLPSNPVLPIPQVASRPLPSTANPPSLTLPNPTHREVDLAAASPRGSLVPFFLVLSFILNVYFGLWLNHLSTKYRHLLGSVRGLTPSTLEG